MKMTKEALFYVPLAMFQNLTSKSLHIITLGSYDYKLSIKYTINWLNFK